MPTKRNSYANQKETIGTKQASDSVSVGHERARPPECKFDKGMDKVKDHVGLASFKG